MFIMVDGIDGSGKSSVIHAWKEELTRQGNTIFDLKQYLEKQNHYPDYSELSSYDFIFSAEPTFTGVGKVIREELIKNGTTYPPLAVAEAYSLDRLILYTKIIIPALKNGKCVIQDRGVSTSLCYQSLMDGLNDSTLTALPGNALALEHRPDHLVLVTASPKIALERLGKRTHKQDDVIFEKMDFLTKIAERFVSREYQTLFTSRGTVIHELSGEPELAIMKAESLKLFESLLHTH